MKTSGSKKISERYASAFFEVAEQQSLVDIAEKDLTSLADLAKNNAEFQDFINNPLLTRAAQEAICASLLKKLKAHPLTEKTLSLLARNKRLPLIEEIAAIFLEKAAASRGEISAELIATSSVSEKDAKIIAEALGKTYNKKVNLSVCEDASLLGGAIVKIGSLQLDGSVSGKLNRLKKVLKVA